MPALPAYLRDTNHACAFMSEQQPLTDRIRQLATEGARFYLCMTVVGELYFAVYASQRKAHNMLHLKNLLARIGVLDFDDSVAEHYGQLQAEQKAKGRPIPSSDAQIAATARIYDLVLLSADHHMCQVDNLLVENWL